MMKNLGKQFGPIVEQRLKELGTNAFAVETRAGLPADAIRNVIRSEKRSGPTLSRVAEICDALGLEVYVGPPRDMSLVEAVVVDSTEFARIPIHDIELAAGTGALNHDELVIDHLAFRRDWLRRIGVAASNARLVRVRGDSMMPTLSNGDLVMLDTRFRSVPIKPRIPGRPLAEIYAFVGAGGECRVKRIEHSKVGVLVFHSENNAYPPEVMTDIDAGDFRVIGKVVWWGHTEGD